MPVEADTVVDELRSKNPHLLTALYLLAFENYLGFESESDQLEKLLSNLSLKK